MQKKWISLLLCIVLFVVSLTPVSLAQEQQPAAAAANIEDHEWKAQSDQVVSVKTANVYIGRLDESYPLTVAEVKGFEDVPFVSVKEYLNLLYDGIETVMDKENGCLRVPDGDHELTLSFSPLAMTCDNWNEFFNPSDEDGNPESLLAMPDEMIAFGRSEKEANTVTAEAPATVSLARDGIGCVVLEDDALLPFCVLQNTIGGHGGMNLFAYNGDDFYDLVSTAEAFMVTDMGEEASPYVQAFRSGRFARQHTVSPAYAKYNYATTCIALDQFFGHKAEKGFTDTDSYIESSGLKEALLSTDPTVSADAMTQLVNKLFDTGHDAMLLGSAVFGSADAKPAYSADAFADDAYDEEAFDEDSFDWDMLGELMGTVTSMGNEQMGMMMSSLMMDMLRPEEYESGPRVDFEGDTAFVYFDSFDEDLDRDTTYYVTLPTEEDAQQSTFALLYDAFEKIKAKGGIKNVVFDLTDNGGGSAAALVCALGFLSPDGEAELTFRDEMSGAVHTEHYHVDTNLDGTFDDNDGFGGQYDFYIVTGPNSYSCGNALPFFSQQQGLAKIIGSEPSGGDCVVQPFVDANGLVCYLSGRYKLGTVQEDTFTSAEDAVTMDIAFGLDAWNLFYNRAAIAELIHEAA